MSTAIATRPSAPRGRKGMAAGGCENLPGRHDVLTGDVWRWL